MIERLGIKDLNFVKMVLEDKSISKRVWLDFSYGNIGLADLLYCSFVYFLSTDDRRGLAILYPVKKGVYEIHLAILPSFRGAKTLAICQEGLDWIFKNIECHKLVAYVSPDNKPMIRLIEKIGFVREGISHKLVKKDGQFIDQIIYGYWR